MVTVLANTPETDTRSDDPASVEARVRAATLHCIGRFGLTKTTFDDIARESGVSRATIYRLFPGGRDTLLASVLAAEVSAFFADLAAELDRHDGLEDRLVAGIGASLRVLVDHEALHAVATLEPELVFPRLAFQNLDGVLSLAVAFAAPFLEPYVDSPAAAASGAEQVVRTVLSYTLHPSDQLDPHDESSIRTLVQRHVLPGLRPTVLSRSTEPGELQ